MYAADAASACVRAIFANVASGSAYFVDDGKVYVWRDMLAELEKVLERRAFLRVPIPFFVLRGAAVASEGYARLGHPAQPKRLADLPAEFHSIVGSLRYPGLFRDTKVIVASRHWKTY